MKTVPSVYTILTNTMYPTVHRQLGEPVSGNTVHDLKEIFQIISHCYEVFIDHKSQPLYQIL